MTARVLPATPPFPPDVAQLLDQQMTGRPPLRLFTTLARDERLFTRFFSAGLLDRGHLTLRQREIVIDRTTALCGAEYEWGVHATVFGERAGISAEQLRSTVHGEAVDDCWDEVDAALIRLCDELHAQADVSDDLWRVLQSHFSDEAIIELLMLAGFYHTVSYLVNALRIEHEDDAARFPER